MMRFQAIPSRRAISALFPFALHLCAGLVSDLRAVELAPDDASISANLSAWFRDAANTFDPMTGVWADASGNGRDAVPVGLVNVAGPVTYLAPTLATTSGGSFSPTELSSVHFSADVEDLLRVGDVNGNAAMASLTIFVVYNVTPAGANTSNTRPVGIGSIAGTQMNPGNHFNLGSDPSIRKDNGQLGAGLYSEPFPSSTTFLRAARMSPTAIDDWFNINGTLSKVFSTGPGYLTSVDDFFIGDLRAGVMNVPGISGSTNSPSNFDVIQTMVYNAALSDEQVAGVSEWLTNHVGDSSPDASRFEITGLEVNADFTTTRLTWNSRPAEIYAVDYSDDLADWREITDNAASNGTETTFEFNNPAPISALRYFRVRR